MKIKKGYRLTVTSWENDGDNYNTLSKDGLSEDMVKFLVDLCKLLQRGELSNLYDPSEKEIKAFSKAVKEVFDKHPIYQVYHDKTPHLCKGIEDDDYCDYGQEILYDFFGGGEFYTRVLQSFTVEYFAKAITTKDVTEQFE